MTIANRILIILLLISHYGWAQQKITGKVLDATTGRPVPYASITALDAPIGTTSNAEGEFELNAVPVPRSLIISDLGHVRDTISVANGGDLQIKLRPASIMLSEVQVGSYAVELIKKAYRELRRNYAQKTYGRAFYRQITHLEGEATEVQEMFWNTKSGNAGLEGTILDQGRYAEKKSLIDYRDFSVYTKIAGISNPLDDSITSMSVVSPNVARYYTLSLTGVTQNGNQQLVEIGFTSKPGVHPRHYQGSLIIDEVTHQILRFRIETPDIHTKSNNPTFSFKNEQTIFELGFAATAGSATRPTYIKVDYQAALSRPLKTAVKVQVSSFTYLFDGKPTPTGFAYAQPAAGQSDLAAIKRATYNAFFWRNNPIVKLTPLEGKVIESFERKGAFGTLLSN